MYCPLSVGLRMAPISDTEGQSHYCPTNFATWKDCIKEYYI